MKIRIFLEEQQIQENDLIENSIVKYMDQLKDYLPSLVVEPEVAKMLKTIMDNGS